MRDRSRLIARLRQISRVSTTASESASRDSVEPEPDRVRELEARTADLEALVRGLQDSVHRESSRQARRIAELEARIQPGTLARSLSEDARARGL